MMNSRSHEATVNAAKLQENLTSCEVSATKASPTRPEFIRLCPPGQRCPWTGLSRSAMNALILPTVGNGYKPPVKSFVLRKRGAKTGVRLISWDSLTAYIYAHEEKGLLGTAGDNKNLKKSII